ncbi:D-amino acid oxidase [Rhizobium sp. Leaf306]|uniref:NAD(P)/FAD-dependent oxidoreductase n=1 Tax=Rhizobium sp. Leaf306 TaxID=1736330 RepID=UPI0007138128|nr:FAD-binding oxidoreductase [Rhizobium sp. Leaf306]KQQ36556.1 D-amino acid oxidase [Rhizobium sp. Leaf306]
MEDADNPRGPRGQSQAIPHLPGDHVDLLIIGGGIMGLWAAVKAERLGIRTLLVEAGRLGQGASGGILGALMSHVPDRWNDKKQAQFDALVALEDEVSRLEGETGLSCGYRRSGRLIPLPKPHLRPIALRHQQEAEVNWRHDGDPFHWHVLDASPFACWPDPAFTEAGIVYDTFAARVSPRHLMAALAAVLGNARHVSVIEGLPAERIDPVANRVEFADGRSIGFGHCMIAAGPQSFPLLGPLSPSISVPLGQPVKGQAALLKADIDPALPILFLNGLYVIAHDDGHVAVGSTSEEEFDAPFATDAKLDDLLVRARALVPALSGAEVVERWAGLRPKAIGREPMVGPHPDHPRVIALTGGFKVSFGLAHRLADAALGFVIGQEHSLPESFILSDHLAVATR